MVGWGDGSWLLILLSCTWIFCHYIHFDILFLCYFCVQKNKCLYWRLATWLCLELVEDQPIGQIDVPIQRWNTCNSTTSHSHSPIVVLSAGDKLHKVMQVVMDYCHVCYSLSCWNNQWITMSMDPRKLHFVTKISSIYIGQSGLMTID